MKRTVFLFAGLLLSGTGLWGCGGVQGINAPTVVESQEAQEKKELVLAGIDFDSGICLAVTAFNQLSDDTVVILRDYGDGTHLGLASGQTECPGCVCGFISISG